MSAQPCGCDPDVAWICRWHLDRAQEARSIARFAARLAAEDEMRDTVATDPTLTALTTLVSRLTEQCALLRAEAVVWRHDQRHIATTLATFYTAPLSMSSVQPVLTLAEELTPGLKDRR